MRARLMIAAAAIAASSGCNAGPIDIAILSPTSLAAGLVGHWTFDEVAGTQVRDTSGNVVDGNVAGRVADITATIDGIDWEPGAELWLQWSDPQLAANADDGLAIDNVRFTASVPEPSSFALLGLAAAGWLAFRRRRK